jgi:DNA-binding winged helix-turn-helix (wHTH) protein/TolB-like protein/tetratricopeptide (TPR) repeat protein
MGAFAGSSKETADVSQHDDLGLNSSASVHDSSTQLSYEFGPFRMLPAERLLARDGDPIPITAKAFDTLFVLVKRNGHLVERAELIHSVWADSFVEEGNLTVVICTLRKLLGDEDENGDRRYIQTVARRGYRFVADVREVVHQEHATAKPAASLALSEAILQESVDLGLGTPKTPIRSFRWYSLRVLGAVLLVLCVALIWWKYSRGTEQKIHALAVLPFRVLNPGTSPDYLSVGMADAIITRLGNTGQIVVRPTSAVQQYARSAFDPLTVGREQKVDAILVGNIEWLADAVSVRVQLVRVKDRALLWGDTFRERPDHMFMLEEEVAERVVRSSPFRLSEPAKQRLARADTTNSKAYQLYLEGRFWLNKRTEQAVRKGISSFQQAIANDPQYALAYAGLADAYVVLGTYGEPPWQLYPNAEQAVSKALELDPSLAAANASRAMISFHYEWNWPKADGEFQRAISLNPNDPLVHAWYAMFLGAMGRPPEARREAELASQLDPMSPIVRLVSARIQYWNHEYDRAIESYKKVIELDPQFASAHTRLGMAYLAKRDLKSAIREFEEAQRISGPDPYQNALLGYTEALLGDTKNARTMIQKLTLQSRREYVPALSIALIYIALGDRELALDWLDHSCQDRSTHMVYAKVDPLLDPLRAESRFNSLLKQMGLL